MRWVYALMTFLCLAMVWLGSQLLFRTSVSTLFPDPPLYKVKLSAMLIAVLVGSLWCGVAAIRSFKGIRVGTKSIAPFWYIVIGLWLALDRSPDFLVARTILGAVSILVGIGEGVDVLRDWQGWWPVEKEESKSADPVLPQGVAQRSSGSMGFLPWIALLWLGVIVLAVFLRSRTGRFEPWLVGPAVLLGLGAAFLGARRRS